MFDQEGLRWRMRKDIDDLHFAKCSTLYSAVFNNVHSYISWGLNFVGSPGHKIYAPRKFDTRNFAPRKFLRLRKNGMKGMKGTNGCRKILQVNITI